MASVDWMKMTVQKTGGLAKLHLSKDKRENGNHSNPDIDTSLSHNNYNIGCADTPDMLKSLKRRTEEVDALYPPQKVRKDRVVACSLYCPCPKEISNKGAEEERKFFEGVHQIYADFFGKENVHGSFIHLDEIHEYTDKDGTSKESLAHAHTIVSAYAEWTEKNKKTGEITERKGINGKNFEKRDRYNKLNNLINDFCVKEWNIGFLNGGIAQKKKVEELKAEEELHEIKAEINKANSELKELESQHENRKTELKKETEINTEELIKIQKERISEAMILEEIHRELDPLKEDLDKYQKLEISSKSCIDLEEKKIPLTQKVAVDITALEFIKSQAKAYRVNRDEVDDIRSRTRELDKREQELNEREQTVQEFNEVCSKEYYRQRNLNKILEQTEEQVKSLKEENQKLKTELNEKNQLIEKLNKTINALKAKVISVYKQFVSAIKAMNMLSYSKEKYKANLTDDQQYLIDGISNYAEKLLRKDKLNELADDVAQHISINNDIQNEMDKLMPHMQHDYDGMCR